MSQDYNQGIFSFSNGFERPQQHQTHQHAADQIRRENKLSGGLPGYEATGMLSEMFNFPSGPTTAAYGMSNEWYGSREEMVVGGFGPLDDSKNQTVVNHDHQNHQISSISEDPSASMQLFLRNPQQPRSPSPSPAGGHFGHFTWFPDETAAQGLSLSLSSSLQAKAEELRIRDDGGTEMMFLNPGQYSYKNSGGLQSGIGFGSSLGVVNIFRNSKYVKAAQELLEEFCSVGRGHYLKKNKNAFGKCQTDPKPNPSGTGSSISSLSASDRIENQRRKVKLLSMLDEVDRRYSHYCEQMQMVVNSFDLVMGFGSALPYTALAQKAMSKHFRSLKDAITAQLKQCCELLGEKDLGTLGVTKGETPRLKLLEQSLRQQRAFHQMGMMDQEAWRPQRGLPERSVNILRAWLFEHFLNPYPSDADKHLLARQTGLSRNQVANWFINARVRLWKPMVEDMYQQENKDEEANEERESDQNCDLVAQAPTPPTGTTSTSAKTSSISTTTITAKRGKRSEINVLENDTSLIAINRQCSSENQAKHDYTNSTMSTTIITTTTLPPPETCHRGGVLGDAHYGTTASMNADIGSTMIRFGPTAGDVSLTLGLRHAGNFPEKTPFF